MKLSFRSVLIAAAACAGLAVSSLAQAQAQPAPAAAPKPAQARPRFLPQLTPEQIAALPKWTELTMTTRDGVKLAANVFLPAGSGPFPVVLSRTPYLKDALGELAGYSAKKYTDAGYAFVMQDVRGKGHSEGFYEAFIPDMEDGYDTVEWVAKQPWSNGRVGMVGASALGITTNLAAMGAPPHLVAAYVIVAPCDQLLNTFPGGVLKDEDTLGWLKGQGESQAQLDQVRGSATNSAFWNEHAMTTQRKFIRIPMYNQGAWYDIFNDGNVENFRWLQNLRFQRGARQSEAVHGAGGTWRFGRREKRYRIQSARRAGASHGGDALVGILAEGRRQRHHERTARHPVHDGLRAARVTLPRRAMCSNPPTGRLSIIRPPTT